ncbi:MAG: C39 family peptidase, partial [Anaerolineales bacterium]|nr:C39 family peptidase [Anaerolineales bacterium]
EVNTLSEEIPTAAPAVSSHTPEPALPTPTATPTLVPTPLPERVSLTTPLYETQDWNNCGPATLSLYLKYYGWEGDQFEISDLLKPERSDRNVNVEELTFWSRNHTGWLNTEFRVGGDIELLKKFIAAGIPVMIEEGTHLDSTYWPNDDRWAGHYLLLTGYDDATQTFNSQDTYYGADLPVAYDTLDANWKSFNRVYILIYPPDRDQEVKAILGPHWDVDYNRQYALETAQSEIDADREDGFAWFNLGSNLVYFERYSEAAKAFDQARTLDLPQRMLRYQFGPFFAYFHSGQTDDLLALTEYALQRTPNAEEALLWHGWGLYRQGDVNGALSNFRAALEANRFYQDAIYALEFISSG